MTKKTIVLGLFADRIDVLMCSGDHVVKARRVPFNFGADAAHWFKAIADAAKPLRTAVAGLDAEGLAATVAYRNPTAYSDYASVGIRSASQATEAAILSSVEALTCPIDEAACSGRIIGRDADTTEPQTHVVVAADHDVALNAIADLVEAAGLKFQSAVPLDAIIMSKIGQSALEQSASGVASLYVGEHRSFFLIADKGVLLFARPINMGLDALSTSLTRTIRASNGGEPIELDIETARQILHTHGFPARETIVHEQLGLIGSQIIPLLQPILQRFIVELRQSLRFGVVEEQRQDVCITMCGPGSAIANFASLIATELRLTVNADERYAACNFHEPDSCGSELMDAIEHRKAFASLALFPRRIAQVRQTNRLRRCLWAGTAAAAVLIGVDFMHYQQQLNAAQQEMSTFQSQNAGAQSLQSTGEKLVAAISAMDRLQANIDSEVGTPIDIRAMMKEVTRLTPESVRLTLISFSADKSKTTGRIAGYAFENYPAQGATPALNRAQLEPFIARLNASPLFEQVVLSNVQTGSAAQMTGQQFEIQTVAVGISSHFKPDALAIADGGQNP